MYLKIIKRITILFVIVSVVYLQDVQAQHVYSLNNAKSKLVVKGTSTIHDWHMEVEKMKGTLRADLINNNLENVTESSIFIEATSLKSDQSGLDKRAYDALKTDSYSNIIFKLTEFKKSQNNLFQIRGKLIIAGVTREIKFEVKGEMLNNGDLKFTGNKSLAMSDYNVEPPTLMFGSITTGNKINISFTAIYEN